METETTVTTTNMMNKDLVKLDRFGGMNFTCWQDILKFMLTTLKIYCALNPALEPIPKHADDSNELKIEQKKQQEDELICWNALSDHHLHNLYTNTLEIFLLQNG